MAGLRGGHLKQPAGAGSLGGLPSSPAVMGFLSCCSASARLRLSWRLQQLWGGHRLWKEQAGRSLTPVILVSSQSHFLSVWGPAELDLGAVSPSGRKEGQGSSEVQVSLLPSPPPPPMRLRTPSCVPSPHCTCKCIRPAGNGMLRAQGPPACHVHSGLGPGSCLRPLLCGCSGLWVSALGHLLTWESWLPVWAERVQEAQTAHHRLASCSSRKGPGVEAPFTQSRRQSHVGLCRGPGGAPGTGPASVVRAGL